MASQFEGHLDWIGEEILGWAWTPARPAERLAVELLIDGLVVSTEFAQKFRQDLASAGIGTGHCSFSIPTPAMVFDGSPHTIEARVAGIPLLGSPARFQSIYDGNLDGLADHRLWGWMVDRARPERALRVEALLDDEVAASGSTRPDGGFEIDLSACTKDLGSVSSFRVRAAGTNVEVANSPAQRVPVAKFVERVTGLGSALLESNSHSELRRDVLPVMHTLLNRLYTEVILAPIAVPGGGVQRASPLEPVDVVVTTPVGTEHDAMRCIRSILGSITANAQKFELTVVLADSDPKPGIEQLRAGHAFHLIEAGGFAEAANRGFALHLNRDVVLINGAAVVSGNWLDRLRHAAYSSMTAGTASALSNAGGVCGYPKPDLDRPIPERPDAVDAAAARANAGRVCDVPVASDVCLYLRRDCLQDTGLRITNQWNGEGEIEDFSIRAAQFGWRHVVAGDVFAGQPNGRSTSAEVRGKLQAMYPAWAATRLRFVSSDPVMALRRSLDLAQLDLTSDEGGRVCFVNNLLGGGVERKLTEDADGTNGLILRVLDGQRVELNSPSIGGIANLMYDLPAEIDALAAALRQLGVTNLHFHTLVNVPRSLLSLPIPYDVTIHDYCWICPRVDLVDDTLRYCGEPPEAGCEECLRRNGAHREWRRLPAPSVAELRRFSGEALQGAREVHAPSRDTAARIERYFPEVALSVRSHDQVTPQPGKRRRAQAGERVRVIVIGSLGINKGFYALRDCARHVHKHRLPLDFIVAGKTLNDALLLEFPEVTILGEYAEQDGLRLVEEQRGHLSFFPTQCPETFSYTLSMAFSAGLFPVAFELGAFGERIRAAGFGRLLEPRLAEDEVVRILLDEGSVRNNT